MSDVQEATQPEPRKSVLITGALGYLGALVTEALAADPRGVETIVALDIREPGASERVEGVTYEVLDIRDPEIGRLMREHATDTVVHLASIVSTSREITRDFQYDVDVRGTENVVEAGLANGVRKLIVTSSGAAYGYHADNPSSLTEDDPLRGNEAFPYAHHKRLVEEMLARYREAHPELQQLILRPGTILGESARGPIADFFEKPVIMGLKGAATPFVFIWDQDVVGCVIAGVHGEVDGIFNLAGDGVMTLREVAAAMGKPFVPLPDGAMGKALTVLKRHGITQYGPEQILFLAHRPVLSNARLRADYPYKLRKTSREAFEIYRQSRSDRVVGGTGRFSVMTVLRELLERGPSPRVAR